jgi:hypothetical protein
LLYHYLPYIIILLSYYIIILLYYYIYYYYHDYYYYYYYCYYYCTTRPACTALYNPHGMHSAVLRRPRTTSPYGNYELVLQDVQSQSLYNANGVYRILLNRTLWTRAQARREARRDRRAQTPGPYEQRKQTVLEERTTSDPAQADEAGGARTPKRGKALTAS